MGDAQSVLQRQPYQAPLCAEVENYLLQEIHMAFNFGRSKFKEYLILCEITWDVFSVLPTSAPIHCNFSHNGIAISSRRASIGVDLLNASLLVKFLAIDVGATVINPCIITISLKRLIFFYGLLISPWHRFFRDSKTPHIPALTLGEINSYTTHLSESNVIEQLQTSEKDV